MTIVYLTVNDWPTEFGKIEIMRILTNKNRAEKYLNWLRKRDEYKYQYAKIETRKISK